jgi:tRNA A-37 threonylcarbamoyl transferase component Bud32
VVDEGPVHLGIAGLGPATRIGSGGFADVFRAEQTSLRREVAVKVLRAPASDERTRMRFERECHAMGPLSAHPNIVSVHEGGFTADGRAYLVMEYFTGGSLHDRLRQHGPLPADEVVEVGVKIGRALGVAHDAGVLHRDVKPANILVSAYGELALGDFGIARVEGGQQTATGQVTASIAHAAPEVLESEPVSPASDVYSLGSTLFELFTGRAPHLRPDDQSVWALMHRVLHQPIPDPVALGMPQPLAAVVSRAAARNPLDRYQRTDDLVVDLSGPSGRPPHPITVPAPIVPASLGSERSDEASPTIVYDPARQLGTARPAGQRAVDTPHPGVDAIGMVADLSTGRLDGPVEAAAYAAEPEPEPARRSERRRLRTVLLTLVVMVAVGTGAWYLYSATEPLPPVVLKLPEAEIGPLEGGLSYELVVDGAGADPGSLFQLLIDDEPVGEPTTILPVYEAAVAGRHKVVVEVTRGDKVESSDPIELYVLGDPPPEGYRVNLASISAQPRNWAATLREFDELAAEDHIDLELYPGGSDENPRWHLFVPGFGDEREAGVEYCEQFFGLDYDTNDCYASFYAPEGS